MNLVRIIANRKGFTLVELIIGMGLTMLLTSILVIGLANSLTVWQAGKNRSEIEQTARYVLDTMAREIRYANTININSKSSITLTQINPRTNKVQEKITFRYGSSESKTIYKITDKTASGGGIGTNPLTPAVIKNLEFQAAPAADHNEVTIVLQAIGYRGDILEYRSTVRCLNVLFVNE